MEKSCSLYIRMPVKMRTSTKIQRGRAGFILLGKETISIEIVCPCFEIFCSEKVILNDALKWLLFSLRKDITTQKIKWYQYGVRLCSVLPNHPIVVEPYPDSKELGPLQLM
jgi:hypothetical protein